MERLRKSRLLLGTLASVLLFQFALMLTLSAWEKLHRELHCDADHADHHCEVTLWRSGAVDTVTPQPQAPAPAVAIELPDVVTARPVPGFIATHFLGGVMAQGPPRGP